ncbi:MAG: hypothetical protein AYK19_02925 [Theionarchaea archaeon DG-70-1]|nr:MAG: hypothetical protein AYK19_02925 [Theionarchaea archaeon DG-70-1]
MFHRRKHVCNPHTAPICNAYMNVYESAHPETVCKTSGRRGFMRAARGVLLSMPLWSSLARDGRGMLPLFFYSVNDALTTMVSLPSRLQEGFIFGV